MEPLHNSLCCPETAARGRPKILVLLAAYNGSAWIDEQIQSILRQENVDVRLIVRDDQSSDSTFEVVSRLASTDPRIELLRADSSSGSASQNFFALIRSCNAEGFDFVALSDQDDVWNPDKLHQAAKSLTKSPASGYSSAVTVEWPSGKAEILQQKDAITESDYLFEGAGQGCTFNLSAAFYERLQIFIRENEGLTRSIHYHDWTIYALARAWGGSWIFDQEPTMRYRQHRSNDTGARSSIKGLQIRIEKIRNGWYQDQLLHIANVCRTAAPLGKTITRWHTLLNGKRSLARRWRIAWACARSGRRRRTDTLALVLSSLAGWI